MIDRRQFSSGLLATFSGCALAAPSVVFAQADHKWSEKLTRGFESLEKERGGNDVAVVWPSPNRSPLFISIYLTGSSPESDQRNATLAAVGRTVANARA